MCFGIHKSSRSSLEYKLTSFLFRLKREMVFQSSRTSNFFQYRWMVNTSDDGLLYSTKAVEAVCIRKKCDLLKEKRLSEYERETKKMRLGEYSHVRREYFTAQNAYTFFVSRIFVTQLNGDGKALCPYCACAWEYFLSTRRLLFFPPFDPNV